MNLDNKTPKPLKDSVFERIEAEKVSPHSRLFFQSREFLVWILWLFSVLVGALAVTVSLFVVFHHQYALYEATHDNLLTYLVGVMPYIWVIVFCLMVYVAVYNLRNTSHGYRYPLWMILTSSVILSLAGGAILQFFGFGFAIDNTLGQKMDLYVSQDKLEQRMWQDPDEGRLFGRQVLSTIAPDRTIIFEDVSGDRWQMNVSELAQHDIELLAKGETVRLLGKSTNHEFSIFYACGVFPWMSGKEVTGDDMNISRDEFMKVVRTHAMKAEQPEFYPAGERPDACTLAVESVCMTIPAVMRMQIQQ